MAGLGPAPHGGWPSSPGRCRRAATSREAAPSGCARAPGWCANGTARPSPSWFWRRASSIGANAGGRCRKSPVPSPALDGPGRASSGWGRGDAPLAPRPMLARRAMRKPAGAKLANGRATIRCAIYTRKSSEEGLEQAFNSLDAQRDACEAFIRSQKHEGWLVLPTLYDDGGISGATMDRPALQRLLADVAAGSIDAVVVYNISAGIGASNYSSIHPQDSRGSGYCRLSRVEPFDPCRRARVQGFRRFARRCGVLDRGPSQLRPEGRCPTARIASAPPSASTRWRVSWHWAFSGCALGARQEKQMIRTT
jgi:Resolvase, N terminal domain